jgi:ADP-heptose:LPS heptosyltransferase
MNKFLEAFERSFRNSVAYPLMRLIFRNALSDGPIDLNHVSRILIFRYDRIGDMIVTTPILRILKRRNPNIRIDVLASRSNAEIVERSPFVDNLRILETNWFGLIRQVGDLRKQRYDVVLNFIFNRTTGPGILANLIAPHGYKVGQGPDRYSSYFNRLAKVRRFEQHMLESYVSMIEQTFGISIDRHELTYEIGVAADSQRTVDEWLEKQSLRRSSQSKSLRLPYIVFNPSGKDEDRSLGMHQIEALVKSLAGASLFRLVVLASPGNMVMNEALRGKAEIHKFSLYETRSSRPLGELASLIEGAVLVISPDTSIVHFASAMQTPVLAIYAPMNASQEWLPHGVTYDVVMAGENQRVSEIEPRVLIEGAVRFVARVFDTDVAIFPELQ